MVVAFLTLGQGSGVQIPFKLGHGHLMVQVQFEGKVSIPLMLDTGSVHTLITQQGARMLLKAGLKADAKGGFTPRRLTIGGFSVSPVLVNEVAGVLNGALDAGGIRGMLGLDVLANYQLGLDVATGTIRLWPKSTKGAEKEWFGKSPYATTPLIKNRDYAVYVELGNVVTPLFVDTGAADTYVSAKLANQIEGKVDAERNWVVLSDGVHRVTHTKIPAFRWAGIDLPPPNRIWFAEGPYGNGILGLDILGRSRVLLDFPGRRALFAGTPGQSSALIFSPDLQPKLLASGGEFTGEAADGSTTLKGWNGVVPYLWSAVRLKDGVTMLIPPSELPED